jgi:hypothetical protein
MPELSEPEREEIYNHALANIPARKKRQKAIIIWEIIAPLLETKIEGYEEKWLQEEEKHEELKKILQSEIEQILKKKSISGNLIKKIINFYFLSDELDRMTLMVLGENPKIKNGANVFAKIKASTVGADHGSMRSPGPANGISWKLLEHLNLIEIDVRDVTKFAGIDANEIGVFLKKRGRQLENGAANKNQPANKARGHSFRIKIIQMITEKCLSRNMKPTLKNVMKIVDDIKEGDFKARDITETRNLWEARCEIKLALEGGASGTVGEIEKEIQIQKAYYAAEQMQVKWSRQIKKQKAKKVICRMKNETGETVIYIMDPKNLPEPLRYHTFKPDKHRIVVLRSQAEDDIKCAERYVYWIRQISRETGSWMPLENTGEKRRVAEILVLAEYLVRELLYEDEAGKWSLYEDQAIHAFKADKKERIKDALDELGGEKTVQYIRSLVKTYLGEETLKHYITITGRDNQKNSNNAASANLLTILSILAVGPAAVGLIRRPEKNENTCEIEMIKNEKSVKNLIKNIAKACEGNEETARYIRPVIANLAQLKPYDKLTKTMQSKNKRGNWELLLVAMGKNVVFRHMVEHLDGRAKDEGRQQVEWAIYMGNGNRLTGKIEERYRGKFGEEIPEEYLKHLTKLVVAKMQEPIPEGMVLNDRNEDVMRLIGKRIQERYQCYIDWEKELQIMASQRGPLGRDSMRELIIELKNKKHEEYLGRVITITDPVADILLRKLDEVPEEVTIRESGNAGQGRGDKPSFLHPGASKMGEPEVPLNIPLLQLLGPGLRIFSGLHAKLMLIRAGILTCLPTVQRQENMVEKANADSYLKALLRYHFFRIPAELMQADNISLGTLDTGEFAWHTRMKARFLGHFTGTAGIVVYIPQPILAILLQGQPGPESGGIYRLRYSLAHALFTSMAAYQGGRFRHKTISRGLNLARQVNRMDFLRNSFIAAWLNQRALRLNPEAYLLERFKHDSSQYGAFFCSLLEDPNSDLSRLIRNKNITSIPEFQKQMLMVLINVLRAHEADLSLLQDVIRFMNYVTPGATRKAGKIDGKSFRMPDLLFESAKRSNCGFIMNYFRKFPGNIIQYQEPSSPLQRGIIRFAEQAA